MGFRLECKYCWTLEFVIIRTPRKVRRMQIKIYVTGFHQTRLNLNSGLKPQQKGQQKKLPAANESASFSFLL